MQDRKPGLAPGFFFGTPSMGAILEAHVLS